MGTLVAQIGETGAPGAGKTEIKKCLKSELTKLGYKVFIIDECATEARMLGITPENVGLLNFQKMLLEMQKYKEKLFKETIKLLPEEEKCVIIHDRSYLDQKAYVSDNTFKKILKEQNLEELKLLDNIDILFYLVTTAIGNEKYYTNYDEFGRIIRKETVEEAIDFDKKTFNAWNGHDKLIIIDSKENIEDKIKEVIQEIEKFIINKTKKQRKYLIDLEKSNLDFMKEAKRINIHQTYLIDQDKIEKRLRKRSCNNEETYNFTVLKQYENGVSKIIEKRNITLDEYIKLLNKYDEKIEINKDRYYFKDNKQYFKLDIFENNLAILEIEQLKEVILPNGLYVIKEVTNDNDYSNYNMAKKNKTLKKL